MTSRSDKEFPPGSILHTKMKGHSPRAVLHEASDTDLWCESAFQSSVGLPLREMAAGASLAFALFGPKGGSAIVRGLVDDPPDISITIEGRTSYWEATDVLKDGQQPRKTALAREAFSRDLKAAKSSVEQMKLVKAQMGAAQVYSTERLVGEQGQVVNRAKVALLKKARKYSAKFIGPVAFGLILYSRIISESARPIEQISPEFWTRWLACDEKVEAELFPDICFISTRLPWHRSLCLRRDGVWCYVRFRQACFESAARLSMIASNGGRYGEQGFGGAQARA